MSPTYVLTDRRIWLTAPSKSKVCYDRRSVGQAVLVSSTHLWPKARFSLLSDSCEFVYMGRPLWWEDRSVVYNCCWPSPASYSQVRVPRDSWPYFTVSDSKLLQPERPGRRIYIPQKKGGPVIPPSIVFPFRRLLRLIGLRWKVFEPASTRGNTRLSTNSPDYNISARNAEKIAFLCCCSIVSVGTCSFERLLLSNGSYIFAYFAVVAQQRVNILQYCSCVGVQLISDKYRKQQLNNVNCLITKCSSGNNGR
jgi:hypothetical protein